MSKKICAFIFVITLVFGIYSKEDKRDNQKLEKITLALKWFHQFQFAGYYAALAKGYYEEAGLEVELTTPQKGVFPVEAVLNGSADFGISSSDLIKSKVKGKPIVLVSTIFQNSPIVLLSRKDKNLRFLSDYVGKLVMSNGEEIFEIKAMFLKEGIPPSSINIVPYSDSIGALMKGEIDAAIDYITDQPFELRKKGVEPRTIQPIDYGVCFYSDMLFTTSEEIKKRPNRVKAFKKATLKGWEYALKNKEEIIDIILKMPGVQERGKTKEALIYEAELTENLIQPELIELGHLNPERLEKMAKVYSDLGLIDKNYSLEGFIYKEEDENQTYKKYFHIIIAAIILTVIFALFIIFLNYKLRKEIKKQSLKIAENEEKFKFLVKNSHDIFVIVDPNGYQKYISPSVEKITGFKVEELEKDFREVIHPDDLEFVLGKWEDCLKNPDKTYQGEYRHIHKTKGWVYLEAIVQNYISNPLIKGIILSVRDITERKKNEEEKQNIYKQLFQSQKLESVGRLAGGVAHDFNNMLAGIIGFAQLIKLAPENKEKSIEYSDFIIKTVKRASELTSKLLSFSRKDDSLRYTVNINDVIEDAASILKRSVDKKIEIILKINAVKSCVKGNPSNLIGIFLNMGINSSHAMPAGGTLTFETTNCILDEQFCLATQFDIEPGEYIKIEVKDTGTGIPANIIDKIFEPFFTTKETGKGTGLGLSAVYGVVLSHKGSLSVNSVEGKGTLFCIHFPISKNPITKNDTIEMLYKGKGLVLLADDEEVVRRSCKGMLENLGYSVITAENGMDAVNIFKENKDKIDLVILDMIMNKMDGKEAFYKMKELKENVKIVVASGFYNDKDINELKENGLSCFIEKPYDMVNLSKILKNALYS